MSTGEHPGADRDGGKTYALLLRIDTDYYLATGMGGVVDAHRQVVELFDTIEEAEAFVARANGTDIATVQRSAAEQAERLGAYRDSLRRRDESS